MKLNATLATACVLVIAGVAAGCGDDNGDGTTTAAASISTADFVAQANQICKQGNAEIEKAGKKLGQSVNEAQLEDFAANTLVPSIQGQIDDVKALGAPAGQESSVNQLISTVQGDVDQLKADPSKVKDDHLFDDANRAANDLGLKECAGGS